MHNHGAVLQLNALIKCAKCVVTNTFHGCVISIMTGTEIAVKMRVNANKLLSLMKEYCLEGREFDIGHSLDDVFKKNS